MQKLPVVSGHEVIKALTKAGFEVVGRKGSHVRLKKKTPINVHCYSASSSRNKDGNAQVDPQTSRAKKGGVHRTNQVEAKIKPFYKFVFRESP